MSNAHLTEDVRGELDALGERMQLIRIARGLSLRDVARVTDGALSQAGVFRIEKGDRYPSAATLLALAQAYDCDIKLTRRGTIVVHGTGLHTNGGMDS